MPTTMQCQLLCNANYYAMPTTHRPNGTRPTDQTELDPPSKRNETHRVKGMKPTDIKDITPPYKWN